MVRSVDKTSMQVKWTTAAAQPGAAAVTGYSVVAIDQAITNGQQVQLGMRTGASATQSTIANLNPASTYTVEVRSLAGPRMSDAYTVAPATVPQPGDTTVPTLALSPAPDPGAVIQTNSVTVTGDGQNFFTTDGSPVVSGGLPSDTARLYTTPIAITGPTTLKVASI
nr:fibronectin type III domain-containing protein [Arthrobacter sp. Soil782]